MKKKQKTLSNGAIIHDVEQGTPEWFAARDEKMTASEATAIGNCGAGLRTYIRRLMSEKYSSADKEHFSSSDTDRGNEYEPIAREIYELERDVEVKQVGFIEYSKHVGCSPDGLVDDDPEGEGGTEIKCINDAKYFDLLLDGESKVDSGHVWQCQMNMKCTGRKWWDLIYYNPNYPTSMLVFRIRADEDAFDKLERGFLLGEQMMNDIKSIIEN